MDILAMRPRVSDDADFQDCIDRLDPFVCTRENLQSLIDDAPEEYAMGFLAGIYCFREQLAIITKRLF